MSILSYLEGELESVRREIDEANPFYTSSACFADLATRRNQLENIVKKVKEIMENEHL